MHKVSHKDVNDQQLWLNTILRVFPRYQGCNGQRTVNKTHMDKRKKNKGSHKRCFVYMRTENKTKL